MTKKSKRVKKQTENNGLIYVGFPRERFMIPEFVDNRDTILSNIQKAGRNCGYFNANGHRVDKNRDNIVDEFMSLESKPEWLLQLDTDMEHPGDIAEALVSHNLPIVGGLYFHRGGDHDPFIFRRVQDLPDAYGRMAPHWAPMRTLVYEYLQMVDLPYADGAFRIHNAPGSLVECDAVATGALLVHRSVFEKIPRPWFEYREYAISEDLMFCKIAKEHGFKIYCDMSVISGHYKMVPIGQAEYRNIFDLLSVRASAFSKQESETTLSNYLQIPLDEATKLIDNKGERPADIWTRLSPTTEEEINDFYRRRDVGIAYIVELIYWNMSDVYTKIRSNLRKIRHKNVLEIGAGIGTIICQLSIQMNNVIAVEPNSITRGYMQARINEMLATPGMECTVPSVIEEEDWWNHVEDESQDYVIAIDVFEHIPIETLRKIIARISEKMKPGGRLLYHNNWEQQDIFPMHINHSEQWTEILTENGFVEISTMESVKK